MPVALALASALCFALGLVLTQFGLSHLPPRRGALVSVPSSAALLWLLAPVFADWHGFEPRGALIFALVGLFFPASVTLLTFAANRQMGPTLSGALGNLAPLFAVLLAALLFGERVGAAQALGIAAILLGVAALTLDRRPLARSWPWWAALLPLAAAAIRGFVQPITKLGLGYWPSPFAAVLLGYSVSALVIAFSALFFRREAAPLRAAGVAWFAAVGVANVMAVLLLYAALARGRVALVSPLVATYPLFTLALSALLLRSAPLQPRLVGGVVLTVAGVAALIAGV